MAEETPRPVGAMSTDGQFEWDGTQWVPRGSRAASRWTRPMQVAAATYLVVLAVATVVINVFLGGDSPDRLRQQYIGAGIAADQAGRLAQSMSGVLVVASLTFAALYLFLAFASARGWGWAFWLDAIALLAGSFNLFSNLGNVVDPERARMTLGAAVLSETVSVLAFAMLCWFVVSLFRFGFGSWARPRRAQASAG
jgi:hypothetical protein